MHIVFIFILLLHTSQYISFIHASYTNISISGHNYMIKKKSTYNTKVFRCSQPLWMIFIYFLSMQLQDNADHKCDACIYYLMFILEIVLTNAFWDAIKCFQFFITWMAACHGKMQRQSFIGNLYVFCVYWNCLLNTIAAVQKRWQTILRTESAQAYWREAKNEQMNGKNSTNDHEYRKMKKKKRPGSRKTR